MKTFKTRFGTNTLALAALATALAACSDSKKVAAPAPKDEQKSEQTQEEAHANSVASDKKEARAGVDSTAAAKDQAQGSAKAPVKDKKIEQAQKPLVEVKPAPSAPVAKSQAQAPKNEPQKSEPQKQQKDESAAVEKQTQPSAKKTFAQSIEEVKLRQYRGTSRSNWFHTQRAVSVEFSYYDSDLLDKNGAPTLVSVSTNQQIIETDSSSVAKIFDRKDKSQHSVEVQCADYDCNEATIKITKTSGSQAGVAEIKQIAQVDPNYTLPILRGESSSEFARMIDDNIKNGSNTQATVVTYDVKDGKSLFNITLTTKVWMNESGYDRAVIEFAGVIGSVKEDTAVRVSRAIWGGLRDDEFDSKKSKTETFKAQVLMNEKTKVLYLSLYNDNKSALLFAIHAGSQSQKFIK